MTNLSQLYTAALKTSDTLDLIASTRVKKMHYRFMDLVFALIIRKREVPKKQIRTAIKLYFKLLEFYTYNMI